ncbi:hypothetical protein YDYSG_60580 [Paenibacillus tyrfis]|uniref:hypothetical protein n=1 Tax=Paenibacillus TaxID=44249 RepID=UPI0024934EB9|nr:hypothetical protein [Paenibacillus tyrfis]GLI10025.1 hypothetical protein YDYSG_60580 [Paenibacillus tyrfis]GMX63130.1 hypothetical protein Elgi_29130 [Paenibacillus elgii]
MSQVNDNAGNAELEDLATHAAGATDLHQTRTTGQAVQIDPPVAGSPGPIDRREERFDVKKNEDSV